MSSHVPTDPLKGLPAYIAPAQKVTYPSVLDWATAALALVPGEKILYRFNEAWFDVCPSGALNAVPLDKLDALRLKHRDEINHLMFEQVRRDLQNAGTGHGEKARGEAAGVEPASCNPFDPPPPVRLKRPAAAPTTPTSPDDDLSGADAALAQLTAKVEARIRAIVREEIAAARGEDAAAEPASDPEPFDEDAYVEERAQRAAQRARLYQRITKREREILAAVDAERVTPRPQPQRAP